MWEDWTNAILGLALLVLAFFSLSGATLMWTLGIGGAIIAIVGFIGASQKSTWQEWTNAVLGIIIFAMAFMNLSGMTLAWSLGILGVVIAIVGFAGTASPSQSSMSHA